MPPVALRRPARRQVLETAHVPAPVGGINTVAAGSDMPAGDCIYLYNMIASEFGLRSRLGYAEHVIGLVDEIRSVMPFTGSRQSGSTDALFAATNTGIFDVTASTMTPGSAEIAFGITTGDAGFGTDAIAATPAGRFLCHCDEENGLYIYAENSSTWTKAVAGATVLWEPSFAYEVGDSVANGPNTYICVSAGTSAGSGGPTGTTAGISDGGVTWDWVVAYDATAIGTSLADQRLGLEADPADFVQTCVWKNRVWYTEKNSSRAWYTDINAIFGTVTAFDFGVKMQHGGPLVGLYNWAYDGGSGLDTLLVGLSTAGDVVIYQGTDPASVTTFSCKGTWFAGAVPIGRRIATDYGGDVLVLSLLGVLSLSKLVIGDPVVERSQYATYKIANLFSQLAADNRTLMGWGMYVHPTDNALVLTVPNSVSSPDSQLAYAFATRGWSQYRGLPMLSAGVWNGTLYFGTPDGRVCKNEGYVDNVQLSDGSSTPVSWSVLTSYQNLGNARNKQLRLIRPTVLSETAQPTVQSTARYGWDLDEPTPPGGAPTGVTTGTWDTASWDDDAWSGSFNPSQRLVGGSGVGRDVAIAIQGSAVSRTTLVGMDLMFEQGGLL